MSYYIVWTLEIKLKKKSLFLFFDMESNRKVESIFLTLDNCISKIDGTKMKVDQIQI